MTTSSDTNIIIALNVCCIFSSLATLSSMLCIVIMSLFLLFMLQGTTGAGADHADVTAYSDSGHSCATLVLSWHHVVITETTTGDQTVFIDGVPGITKSLPTTYGGTSVFYWGNDVNDVTTHTDDDERAGMDRVII